MGLEPTPALKKLFNLGGEAMSEWLATSRAGASTLLNQDSARCRLHWLV